MPGASRVDLIFPGNLEWGAPNDLSILALRTDSVDHLGYLALPECLWYALIYDTSVSRMSRYELVFSRAAPGAGDTVIESFGPLWEGSYAHRGRYADTGSMGLGLFADLRYTHNVLRAHRRKPLLSGCPFTLVAIYPDGSSRFDFGVGPESAWNWPRDGESVRISGGPRALPPPLDKLAAHVQAVGRDERRLEATSHKIDMNTAGVDAGSKEGQILGAVVVSGGMLAPDRRPWVLGSGPPAPLG